MSSLKRSGFCSGASHKAIRSITKSFAVAAPPVSLETDRTVTTRLESAGSSAVTSETLSCAVSLDTRPSSSYITMSNLSGFSKTSSRLRQSRMRSLYFSRLSGSPSRDISTTVSSPASTDITLKRRYFFSVSEPAYPMSRRALMSCIGTFLSALAITVRNSYTAWVRLRASVVSRMGLNMDCT